MTALEHRWREWLKEQPEVRAMEGSHVRAIQGVWLAGAQAVLHVIAEEVPEGATATLEQLQAAYARVNTEILGRLEGIHGRTN